MTAGVSSCRNIWVAATWPPGSSRPAGVRRFGAALVAALCDALHYTHTHDLFHRDIKPANILLDASGEPYLADFGLALKDEDCGKGAHYRRHGGLHEPGAGAGRGPSRRWPLGHLQHGDRILRAAHRPPAVSGETRMQEVIEQIVSAEPRPPRQIDDTIPRELERICLKAIAKRASERYSTARDMAEDLRHFLMRRQPRQSRRRRAAATGCRAPRGTAPSSSVALGPIRPRAGGRSRSSPRAWARSTRTMPTSSSSCLPGPRDRDGLPDSLRFWKTRIEATDADKAFRVGLVYGPSGCGKSSLVKAGLLPLLGEHVVPVYVESTAGRDRSRLLAGHPQGVSRAARRGRVWSSAGASSGAVGPIRGTQGAGGPRPVRAVALRPRARRGDRAGGGASGNATASTSRHCAWCGTTSGWRPPDSCATWRSTWSHDRNVAAVDLFDPRHARKVPGGVRPCL